MPRTSKRLGRGLDALLPSMPDDEDQQSGNTELLVDSITPNPYQPRHDFDEDKLRELAQSISQHGLIQPVLVRQLGDDRYELIAGERRLRAAKLAGLEVIPAVVGEFTDGQVMELALVENLQREDLNPIEEALAYQTLLEEFGLTQERLAERIGKSRPYISNTVRLLNLPEQVQQLIGEGRISAGHARALLAIERAEGQLTTARKIINEGLTVRQVEKLVRQGGQEQKKKEENRAPEPRSRDPELVLLEDQLRQTLGAPVRITAGSNKGTIQINYYDQEDLARIFEKIVGIEDPL